MSNNSSAGSLPVSKDPHTMLRSAQLLEQHGRLPEATSRYQHAIRALTVRYGENHPVVQSASGSYRVCLEKRRTANTFSL